MHWISQIHTAAYVAWNVFSFLLTRTTVRLSYGQRAFTVVLSWNGGLKPTVLLTQPRPPTIEDIREAKCSGQ